MQQEASSKIGIFGGTFDPIHRGHLDLARHALKQFRLTKVLFVPALIPPHKSARRDMTPAPYRYRMVETAVREEPQFEVSDIEFSRPEISYTVDTLRTLKKFYPSSELYLILGADSLAEIPKWREADEIVKLARLLVARRPGVTVVLPPYSVQWIDMSECSLSSSEIRQAISRGDLLPDEIVPQDVQDYIQKMQLYRKQTPCT